MKIRGTILTVLAQRLSTRHETEHPYRAQAQEALCWFDMEQEVSDKLEEHDWPWVKCNAGKVMAMLIGIKLQRDMSIRLRIVGAT
jgi:hypothetical protein